jgi:plastocyanin
MNKKRLGLASLALPAVMAMLLMMPVTASAGSDKTAAASAEVKIDNFSFGPQILTTPVGTTVTWTNRDDIPHTIVSTDGLFESKVRDTDETFAYTFTKAGTYTYFCSVHPKMTGKIIVQ